MTEGEDRMAAIQQRLDENVVLSGYEASGTGLHNAYMRDVPYLLNYIRALRDRLLELQA